MIGGQRSRTRFDENGSDSVFCRLACRVNRMLPSVISHRDARRLSRRAWA